MTMNQTLSLTDAVLVYLHRYERYLRSSGGAWSRASGYALQVRTQNYRNAFYSFQEYITIQDPYTKAPKQIPLLKPNATRGVYATKSTNEQAVGLHEFTGSSVDHEDRVFALACLSQACVV